jgi:rhamnogalacturonyl hydrolase YesR
MLIAWLVTPGAFAQPSHAPSPGRSDPAFHQPSIAQGVDYTVPTRDEIKVVLDRILDNFLRSTSFQVIDTATGQPVTDFSTPVKTAAIDLRRGEYGDWNYSFGTALSAMLQVSDVTGDARYRDYVFKSFDFLFTHLDYFRRQAAQFGRPSHNYRRLLEFHELDDCGAIGAALVRTHARKPDPRYEPVIQRIDEHIAAKQLRLADGTLARPRPYPVAVWIDDAYMAISFLTAMGKQTGEKRYFDDAARQVIGMSARLFHEPTGLYDHSWFEHAAPYDPIFYWGRGAGWMLMAMTELLSDMPEQHPDRGQVLEQFRKAVQGVARVQSGTGLWHQLLDKPDSYLETSASAMFTYAIARGVTRGWIPAVYAPVAQAGWRALESRVRADGNIDGICVGTTAAADAVYYYNRPTSITALQGHGAMLMAGAAVMVMVDSFDINRTNNTYYYRVKK